VGPTEFKIIKEIALKENLPVETVKKIVESQFYFVRAIMAEGKKGYPKTFKTIQLTHLGKFALREKMLRNYARKYKRGKK